MVNLMSCQQQLPLIRTDNATLGQKSASAWYSRTLSLRCPCQLTVLQLANLSIILHNRTNPLPSSDPVMVMLLPGCDSVARVDGGDALASVQPRDAKILRTLVADPEIRIQIFLDPATDNQAVCGSHTQSSSKLKETWTQCLNVNIYGSPGLFDHVGTFASKCQLYLQDPRHCDRNVEYRNPHRMPFEEAVYTYSLHLQVSKPEPSTIEIREPMDMFRDIGLEEELAETESPPILTSSLQS